VSFASDAIYATKEATGECCFKMGFSWIRRPGFARLLIRVHWISSFDSDRKGMKMRKASLLLLAAGLAAALFAAPACDEGDLGIARSYDEEDLDAFVPYDGGVDTGSDADADADADTDADAGDGG
jgi:hypothetical protein